MEPYTQDQWVLLFFLYSVLGWVWESCYVSLKSRQWVNRGFLHGPWLPIYGSGAIVILLLTLPARGRPALIFLLGMVGATVLEYVTGAVMERLFHMRYWDYSDKPLNVNGHICLPVSIAWGGFSLLLIYLLHPPVEELVLWLPGAVTEKVCLCLAVLFAGDTALSVQKALDLKALLTSLSATSQRLQALEEKLKSAAGQLGMELEGGRLSLSSEPGHRARESRRAYLLRRLEERRDRTSRLLDSLDRKSQAVLAKVDQRLAAASEDRERQRLEDLRAFLTGVDEGIRKTQEEVYARRTRDFQRAVDLLYRNPSATSRHHVKAFQTLSALKQRREGKK
ncbi:putative ABC transporter permease [Evtepia sp.]|uniref:putative ABC transporter permease n=1 Tax=Evtepia sp. TaxID=2773933 RepID=UPI00399AC548